MKMKNFVIIAVAALVILSSIITAFPLVIAELKEAGLNQDPTANGDVYYYRFSTTTFFYANNSFASSGLPWGGSQSGTITLTFTNNIVEVKRIVNTPSMKALGVDESTTYVNVSNFSINSPFIQNFINFVPRADGTFTKIQNEFGIVKGNVANVLGYYKGKYTGSNQTLHNYSGASFVTMPFAIEFPKMKNSVTTWVPYNTFNLYDYSGNANILVESMLGGVSPFLLDIINGSISIPNPTSPIVINSEYFFSMELKATNVALQPLALPHYLLEYLPITLVLWVIVMPSVYFTVIRKKRRR